MKDTQISIILPVHELDETTKKSFANAVTSVKNQTVKPDELVIVVPKGSDVAKYTKSFDYGDFKDSVVVVENDGKTDFASQINFGVSKAKSEWVSVLEYDDEFASIWIKNVVEYRTAHTDVDMFLPIIVDVDTNSSFVGFSNEAVWANGFCDELGILNNDSLLAYQNFSIDGTVFKKSLFELYGGIKSNIKLTFVYEFLLRMTFKAVKIMVIPKFGYKHVNQRSGSLFASYQQTIYPLEARWWLSTAKKESFFQKDREITYDTQLM